MPKKSVREPDRRLATRVVSMEDGDEELGQEFRCAISSLIMAEPMVAADGFCYERAEIEKWLARHDRSPMTNTPLPHKFLNPNRALKQRIRAFLDEHLHLYQTGDVYIGPRQELENRSELFSAARADDVKHFSRALVRCGCRAPFARPTTESKDDVGTGGASSDTVAHIAARAGSIGVLSLLLDRRADPNARNGDGAAVLHAAASAPDDRVVRVIEVLLGAGTDVAAIGDGEAQPTPAGPPAASAAATPHARPRITRLPSFGDKRSSISRASSATSTPNAAAVQPTAVAHRASADDEDSFSSDGDSDVQGARDGKLAPPTARKTTPAAVNTVRVESKPVVAGRSSDDDDDDDDGSGGEGKTSAVDATAINVKQSDDSDAQPGPIRPIDVDARDAQGRTCLHLLVRRPDALDAVSLLLERKCAVDSRDHSGATLMHEAARAGNKGALTLLLAAGADAAAKDGSGRAPSDICSRETEAWLRLSVRRRAAERLQGGDTSSLVDLVLDLQSQVDASRKATRRLETALSNANTAQRALEAKVNALEKTSECSARERARLATSLLIAENKLKRQEPSEVKRVEAAQPVYAQAVRASRGKGGAEKDPALAFEGFRKAAQMGHAQAMYHMGICYENGFGVGKDLKRSFEWYEAAALQGDARAQTEVGYFFRYGIGIAQDHAKAVEWYTRAAEGGHAVAQYNLGLKYLTGQGVECNRDTGIMWLRRAAMQKDRDAQKKLSKMGVAVW